MVGGRWRLDRKCSKIYSPPCLYEHYFLVPFVAARLCFLPRCSEQVMAAHLSQPQLGHWPRRRGLAHVHSSCGLPWWQMCTVHRAAVPTAAAVLLPWLICPRLCSLLQSRVQMYSRGRVWPCAAPVLSLCAVYRALHSMKRPCAIPVSCSVDSVHSVQHSDSLDATCPTTREVGAGTSRVDTLCIAGQWERKPRYGTARTMATS